MMEFTRQISLSDPTYRHLQGCRDEMTDVFLRKFSCEVELRGPKGGSYSAPSITPDEKVYERRMLRGPVISVWRGDLTKQDADVVVNAANEDLDHAGGLARALAEAGGPIVVKDSKDYIRAHGRLKTSEYAVTRAGDLPCKHLLHVVGPMWCDDTAARCEAELAKCIENVLTYVTKNQAVQSVAIPAISSGIFGFPLQKCAEIIARSVRTFFYSVTATHLREIRLMNNDEPTVRAMKRACEIVFGPSDALIGATAASGSQTGPVTRSMAAALQPSSSAASNKNVYGQPSAQRTPQPVTINGLTLNLVQGFIQEQNTAVIVNSLGTDLDMRVGRVSNAILQKAGNELQHDVNRARFVYPLPLVIPTSAYRLPCAAVYHVILQAGYSRSLLEALPLATFECLKIAQMHNVPSISFPALGTGNFGLSKPNAAQTMLDSVTTFARGYRGVMNVFIVIHPQDSETYKAFEDQWNVRGWNQNPTSEAEERDPRPEVRGESSDAEIQCLVIRGTREEHVEEAKVWMTNVLRPQPVSIQNNLVLLFGKEEHDVLTSAEAALVEERLSDGTSLVTIDGPPQEKVRAVMEVERLLCDVQEKHGVTLEEELLEAAVMWFYENKGGARRYSAKANRELERAYVTQQDVTLQSDPHHVISMKTLTAQGDGGAFQLQRRTIDDSSMNGQTRRRPEDYISRVILVDPKSPEFKDQENHFKTQNLTLVKMEKIHNTYLTQIFQSKKGAKPSEKKTRQLYQLVPRAFTELICHVGFQRVFSNPKDARFGQGIYFADSPRRALECFQTPEEEGGRHHIFQAEVVTDSSEVIRDAPALVPKKSSRGSNSEDILDLCDSLVNASLSPYIFVIPDSFQANPLYLFTCRRQELNLVWK